MNRMFVRIGQYIKGDTKFELVKNDLLSIVIQNNTPRLPVQLLQKICGKNEKYHRGNCIKHEKLEMIMNDAPGGRGRL